MCPLLIPLTHPFGVSLIIFILSFSSLVPCPFTFHTLLLNSPLLTSSSLPLSRPLLFVLLGFLSLLPPYFFFLPNFLSPLPSFPPVTTSTSSSFLSSSPPPSPPPPFPPAPRQGGTEAQNELKAKIEGLKSIGETLAAASADRLSDLEQANQLTALVAETHQDLDQWLGRSKGGWEGVSGAQK